MLFVWRILKFPWLWSLPWGFNYCPPLSFPQPQPNVPLGPALSLVRSSSQFFFRLCPSEVAFYIPKVIICFYGCSASIWNPRLLTALLDAVCESAVSWGPLPVLSQPKRGSSSWLSQPHADVPTDSELNCTAPRRQPLRSCLGPSSTVFRESLESWHLWQNTVKCCSLPHMLIKEGESGFGAQLSMMAKHYLFFMNNRRHLACS